MAFATAQGKSTVVVNASASASGSLDAAALHHVLLDDVMARLARHSPSRHGVRGGERGRGGTGARGRGSPHRGRGSAVGMTSSRPTPRTSVSPVSTGRSRGRRNDDNDTASVGSNDSGRSRQSSQRGSRWRGRGGVTERGRGGRLSWVSNRAHRGNSNGGSDHGGGRRGRGGRGSSFRGSTRGRGSGRGT